MRRKPLALTGVAALTAAALLAVSVCSTAWAAETTGTLAGHLTTAAGAPAADVRVTVYDDQERNWLADGQTSTNGDFVIPGLPAGKVKVNYERSFEQWAVGKTDYEHATVFPVKAGDTTTVNDQLLPSGAVAGLLVDAAGAPVPNAQVLAEAKGLPTAYAFTDADGRYSLEALPGEYTVSFAVGWIRQWAHQARTAADAAKFTVAAGESVTVDETLLPTGSVAGKFLDAKGKGIEGVTVFLVQPGQESSSGGVTAQDGSYELSPVLDGTYKVRFSLPDGSEQWAYGKRDEDSATPVTVTAGQRTTVNDGIAAPGAIAGRFTTRAGKAVAKATVWASADGEGEDHKATTDSKGNYRLSNLPAGTYKVRFSASGLQQWAYAKSTAEAGATVTVGAGKTTTVNDQQVPGATLSVTAKDAKSGKLIKNFCAETFGLDDQRVCTKGSTATIKNLRADRYSVDVRPADGSFYRTAEIWATATAGKTTTVTAKLALGGAIAATATDRKTGKALADTCVVAITPGDGGVGDGGGDCTDKKGKVRTQPIAPGTYNLWVEPHGSYGAQWVTKSGGIGDQRKAVKITVKAGKATSAPAVKLDKAGTISGTVRTAADGKTAKNVNVSYSAWGFGVGPSHDTETDSQGRYKLTDLGPYAWPLVFTGSTGRQWSGNKGNRFEAKTVTVRAGKTVTYNESLVAGATLGGTATRASGTYQSGFVNAYNVVTGDPVGNVWLTPGTPYQMKLAGGQTVVLEYEIQTGANTYVSGWHGGKDRAHATKVTVPKTGGVTVNLTFK